MNLDEIILEILEKISSEPLFDIHEYCLRFPEYKEIILLKFKVAKFLTNELKKPEIHQKKLGDSVLLSEIGRGGMGIVFLAQQPALGRLNAIKILPPLSALNQEALSKFKDEAKIIAKFNHPNIVPIYSIAEDSELFYIVMGYVSGIPLRNLIYSLKVLPETKNDRTVEIKNILEEQKILSKIDSASGSIGIKRTDDFWNKVYYCLIAQIGFEIASALSYAHEANIIHGDIKPSNILLNTNGIPILIDFGLSEIFQTNKKKSSTEFEGTILYAAPEQVETGSTSKQSDVWSLGVTLYELLTLKHPFADSSLNKTCSNIINANPVPLCNIDKRIPRDLEAIVLKCLEKNLSKRYSSISELSQDLNRFLENKPVLANPSGVINRFWKWRLRNPIGTRFLLLLIPTLIIISFFLYNMTIYALYNKASNLLHEDKNNQAIDIYKKLGVIGKFIPYAKELQLRSIFDLAIWYYDNKDYSHAITPLQIYTTKVDQKCIDAYLYLSKSYIGLASQENKSENLNNALIPLRIALSISPNDERILLGFADVLYEMKVSQADTYNLAIFKDNFGLSQDQLNYIQGALARKYYPMEDLKNGSESHPEDQHESDKKKGEILKQVWTSFELAQQKKWDEALTNINKVLEADPQNVFALEIRGSIYTDGFKNYDAAMKDYDKAIFLAPYNSSAHYGRGFTYEQIKNDQVNALAASKDFTLAILNTPSFVDAYVQRAGTYIAFGDYKQAIRDIETARRLKPESNDLIKYQYQIYAWASDELLKRWHLVDGTYLYIKKCLLYQKMQQDKIKIPEKLFSQ